MSEFEQQVAEALELHMENDQHVTLRAWAESLAPRVAAAIDEIARAYAEDVSGERGNPTQPGDEKPLWNSLRQDALKKLRGEP